MSLTKIAPSQTRLSAASGSLMAPLESTPRAAKSASQLKGTARATKFGTTFSLSLVRATHWRNSRTRYHVRCRRHSPNVQELLWLPQQPKAPDDTALVGGGARV